MTQSAASGGEMHEEDKPRLGELLVAMGALTDEQLREVLARQRETGLPLGRMLVESGHVMAHTVAMALADQHGGLLRTEYGFATGHSEPVPVKRIDVEEEQAPPEQAASEAPVLRLAEVRAPASDGAEVAELRATVEQLQAEKTTILNAATDLRAAALAERAKREAAEAALAELRDAPAANGAETEELRGTVEQLRSDLAAANETADRLRADAAATPSNDAELDALTAELATARRTIDELRAVPTADNAELDALTSELATARQTIEELRSELATARARSTGALPGFLAEGHRLFFRVADGYRYDEVPGPPPDPGAVVSIDGVQYEVMRVSVAPTPGATNACAYLEPR